MFWMHPRLRHLLTLSIGLSCWPAPGATQLVPIKTVPVATGDQFLIFPSSRLGMSGLSIALEDRLGDPFVNPAAGSRLRRSQIFGSPALYHVSDGDGSGTTLPLGFLGTGDRWFGALSLAIQELDQGQQFVPCCWAFDTRRDVVVDPRALENRSATNHYLFGSIGRRLSRRTAVGFSASRAHLNAVDGVDLLYASSQSIDQDGSATDLRLGLTHDLGRGENLELLLLHRRLRMQHDVRYLDIVWEPNGRTPQITTREVRNLDHTDVWGAHAEYVHPIEDDWRIGGIATINYLTHPKIPNYEIMNIPRDPGDSWAYNIGFGVARDAGPLSFGVEAVYEPIWSHTWADTDTTIVTADKGTIEPGGKTIDNQFEFANSHLRVGLGRDQGRWGFQLGLHVQSISYELEQENLVLGGSRNQEESWLEWTPSWGLSLRFPDVQVRYGGRLTSGTGRPGIAWTGARAELASVADFNFILAPSGPLSLDEVAVLSHQLTVSLPIGGDRDDRSRRRR